MMPKSLVILALLLLSLTACSDNAPQSLDTPDNLHEEAQKLYWNPVEDAQAYIVKINSKEHITVHTTFSLHDHEEGSYQAKVKAINNDTESSFTETLTINVFHIFKHPKTFNVNDGTLVWENLEANEYVIEANGETTTVEDHSFDMTKEQTYSIRVKAVYDDGESIFSKLITVQDYTILTRTYIVYYSMQSDEDAIVILDNSIIDLEITKDSETWNEDDFTLDGNLLTLKSESIKALGKGTTVLRLESSEGLWSIELTIDNSSRSRILSNTHIVFQENQNVVLQAETYGQGIHGVSGSLHDNLLEEEYSIDGDVVTINNAYFKRLFDADSERSCIIMNITLNSHNNEIIIFNLFVDRN